jgi:hypothetical protein
MELGETRERERREEREERQRRETETEDQVLYKLRFLPHQQI